MKKLLHVGNRRIPSQLAPDKLKAMMVRLMFVALILFVHSSTSAQKIALIGFNANHGDGFSFVVGNEGLGSNEVVYFTDKEYDGPGNFLSSGGGHWQYTAPSGGLAEGQVVTFAEDHPANPNTFIIDCSAGSDCGTMVITDGINIQSDEIIYAYTDNDNVPHNGITEIYSAFKCQGTFAAAEDPTLDHAPSSNAVMVDGFPAAGSHRDFKNTERSTATTHADIEDDTNYDAPPDNINQTLDVTAFQMGVTLPIDLIKFDARRYSSQVILDWATASETDNMGFEIEKSKDARTWSVVGFVEGFGTVTQVQNYKFVDETPYIGLNYYRLKQMDFDGNYNFSPVETIEVSGEKELSVFPTIASDEVTIRTATPFGKRDVVEVYNIIGKKVMADILPEDGNEFSLNITALHTGHYLLRLTLGGDVVTKRVVKR